jgi:uncharacterized protein (TIGR03118 family)
MKRNTAARLSLATLLTVAVVTSLSAQAQFYHQTNLVSDLPGMAEINDPQLVNPWGVTHSATSPFWVSDAGKSVATLYSVNPTTGVVSKLSLVVTVPVPSGALFNGSADFGVSLGAASGPALFIFAELNGTISGWNPSVPPPPPSTQSVLAATGTPPAAYTGLALGALANGHQFLYATNPAGNRIDAFDNNFTKTALAGSFTDPTLPAGLAPFGIANINGQLFVSYAPMGGLIFGPGLIDVFDTSGNFVKRFATGGTLFSPWGMVVAPADFGKFSNALLAGNFNLGVSANGKGNISAFDLQTGEFLGLLDGTDGNPLAIDGLWQLIFGNGGSGGNPDVLYFSAGIQGEQHGLFAALNACHGPVISNASASPDLLWPPNHQAVPVTVAYTVTDDCVPAPACTLSVSSNEGEGGGSGNTSPDWTVVDSHTVDLVAERAGTGDGRIYTVTINCKDTLPLSSSAQVVVTVPHSQGN